MRRRGSWKISQWDRVYFYTAVGCGVNLYPADDLRQLLALFRVYLYPAVGCGVNLYPADDLRPSRRRDLAQTRTE